MTGPTETVKDRVTIRSRRTARHPVRQTGPVPLTVSPCRQLCDWICTPTVLDDLPVLACRGCGSQWVRSQPWTPAQADGSRPAAVLAELSRPADAVGTADS